MGENGLTRRSFLRCITLLGCLSTGAGSFLASCQKIPEGERQGAKETAKGEPASGGPCTDVSGLTEQERQTRVTYKYVGKSTIKGKYCSNCRFFVEPAGGPCGRCEIVKGLIRPDGYCTAWMA